MSLKEKVAYTLLGAAGLTGLVVLTRNVIIKKVENKAHEKSFEDGTPQTIAKQIKMAFENDGYWGTDIDTLRKVLTDIKSKAQLKKIYDAYSKEYHSNLYKDMSDELQTTEYNEMLQIIAAKPDKEGQAPTTNQFTAWAKRLKAAFDKTYAFISGTDEKAIKAVFNEIPTQTAFIQVGKAYYKEYGDNLITVLKSELEVWEYGDYMKIITSKRKA
jgi:RNA binding exosome subunit